MHRNRIHGLALVSSSGNAAASSPIRTADDLAAAFLIGYSGATREAYARDLRHWGLWLSGQGVGVLDAHRAHVEHWARGQEEQGAAPATVARRLSTLAGFYAYALDEDLIGRSPVTRVRRPKVSEDSPRMGVDRDGLRELLAAAAASSVRDEALVTLLVLTGVRISEALGADIADVGAERGHVTLALRRKGGKLQRIALPPRAAEAIDRLVAGREVGPIFITRSGRRLDRHGAQRTVRALARRAGIQHTVSPHSLRHSWVTQALDGGCALHIVQVGAGHADPRTTQRYNRQRDALDGAANYVVAAHVAA